MKLNKLLALTLLGWGISTSLLWGQYAVSGVPLSSSGHLRSLQETRSASQRESIILPRLSEHLIAEQIQKNNESQSRRLVFAVPRSLDIDPRSEGVWSQDATTGDYVWRLTLTSPEAHSIGLRLEDYDLPEGASLYVWGDDGRIHGAFTRLNNSRSQVLQLAPVRGERITIEYNCPKEQGRSSLPFRIATLYHDFRGVQTLLKDSREGLRANGPGEPLYNYNNRLPLLSCAPNVIKFPERSQQARSVVLMIVGGVELCTGTLINNTESDGTPYILTAAHCINGNYGVTTNLDAYIKRVTEGTVIFFGFESPIPDTNVRGSEEKTLVQTEAVAYNPEADMALLRILGLPTDATTQRQMPIPPAYNAYFSGWNISASPSAPFFGIHHPYASTKRYSEVEDQTLSLIDYQVGDSPEWTRRHWRVRKWLIGTTDAGSSGSALFDKDGLIIGALTGGGSTCNSPLGDSYYAIRTSWRIGDSPEITTSYQSLASWLDPKGSGVTSCSGYDPLAQSPIKRVGPLYQSTQIYEINNVTEQPELTGVGNQVELDATQTQILGAYLLFRGDDKLKQGLPELQLSLRPIEQGGSLGSPVWQTDLTTANYIYYSSPQANFTSHLRTLTADTIEIFVPTLTQDLKTQNLSGNYLLACQTSDGGTFTLPLLTQKHRANEGTLWPAWQADQSKNWSINTQTPYEGYWIDLVLQGDKQVTFVQPQAGRTSAPFVLYYSEGIIYVYNNTEDAQTPTTLSVYATSGELVYRTSVEIGTKEYRLPNLVTGAYLAQIERAGKRQAIKFQLR